MSTSYIIQFINQGTPTQFCVGATSLALNAPVVLSLLTGAGSQTTQWNLDPNTGHIQLAATAMSAQPLYLTIPGTSIVQGAQLLIAPLQFGTRMQSWNWVGSPPRITSNAPPGTFCVDNDGCTMSAGNKIMIFPNSGACQTWQFLPVSAMAQALEAASKSADRKRPKLHA